MNDLHCALMGCKLAHAVLPWFMLVVMVASGFLVTTLMVVGVVEVIRFVRDAISGPYDVYPEDE